MTSKHRGAFHVYRYRQFTLCTHFTDISGDVHCRSDNGTKAVNVCDTYEIQKQEISATHHTVDDPCMTVKIH